MFMTDETMFHVCQFDFIWKADISISVLHVMVLCTGFYWLQSCGGLRDILDQEWTCHRAGEDTNQAQPKPNTGLHLPDHPHHSHGAGRGHRGVRVPCDHQLRQCPLPVWIPDSEIWDQDCEAASVYTSYEWSRCWLHVSRSRNVWSISFLCAIKMVVFLMMFNSYLIFQVWGICWCFSEPNCENNLASE